MILPADILQSKSLGYFSSFGRNNPDKTFLIIQQKGKGRGLFSLMSSVLCWLDLADKYNFIPVIDFENFETEYNESADVNGIRNAFEYYFKPVSSFLLDEVYSSERVILTSSGYPSEYSYSITNEFALKSIYNKYIGIHDDIVADAALEKIANTGDKVLGVHFRGQEFRKARGHWLPPSNLQIVKSIESILDRWGGGQIFVCTEDLTYLEFLEKKFPGIVISHNHFRTRGDNAYKQSPRKQHKYLLGREVLVDMLTLSQCTAFIGCTSNVAEMARFVNGDKFEMEIKINNGPNFMRWPFSNILWDIKNVLPASFGGFKFNNSTLIFQSKV